MGEGVPLGQWEVMLAWSAQSNIQRNIFGNPPFPFMYLVTSENWPRSRREERNHHCNPLVSLGYSFSWSEVRGVNQLGGEIISKVFQRGVWEMLPSKLSTFLLLPYYSQMKNVFEFPILSQSRMSFTDITLPRRSQDLELTAILGQARWGSWPKPLPKVTDEQVR